MRAEHIKTVEGRHGRISYFADDEYIGRVLGDCGEYSPGEPELWAKLLKPGDNAVDVGANIGALTLPLARIVGMLGGKVIAYEPQPENFGLLRRNIEQNELGEVVILWANALGAEAGSARVPMLCELENHNYGGVAIGAGSQAVSLSTLDQTVGIKVGLIKIDVEGNEIQVIEGARGTIEKCRPFLYVENDRQENSEALLALIRLLGYRIYEHRPPIAPERCFAQDNNGRGLSSIVSLNLLCAPKEKTLPEVTADLKPVVPASPRLGKSGWAGIARLGGIGDNLIAASVLRPLKKQGYKIDVITQMPMAVVFENNPYIDKLSVKLPGELPAEPAAWQHWFEVRSHEYDIFANLSHTVEVSLAMIQAQMPRQWPSAMRRKYYGHNYLEFAHDVVGMPYDFGPLFFPTEEERDQAIVTRKKVGAGPLIGWVLNGSRLDKVYPKAPMMLARLIRELGAQVIMFGGPPPYPDFQNAKQIQEHVIHQNGDDRGLHLALSPDGANPTWPLRRILTQLQECDLVIGPDTGQMWAVAMEPLPKIVLHSHASVQNIAKHWINTTSLHADPIKVRCWPCHLLHDKVETCLNEQRRHGMTPDPEEKGAACIQTISVEAIVCTARTALEKLRG